MKCSWEGFGLQVVVGRSEEVDKKDEDVCLGVPNPKSGLDFL